MHSPEKYLSSADPVLAPLFRRQGSVVRGSRSCYFESLCRAVIGQQVSLAAAATIFSRFEQLTKLEPSAVLALSERDVKAVGLSCQKCAYLKDLAGHFLDNPQAYDHLERLSDDEVIAELTKVKGIGIWTEQMFLIFTLQRPDVFAPDDVGLQNAIKRLYGLEAVPLKRELERMAEAWQPYRTAACWQLWESLKETVA